MSKGDELTAYHNGVAHGESLNAQQIADLKNDLAKRDAQLAQAQGELAVLRQAVESASNGGDGECVWCQQLTAIYGDHAPDCPRQLALSSPSSHAARAAAVLVEAAAFVEYGVIGGNDHLALVAAVRAWRAAPNSGAGGGGE